MQRAGRSNKTNAIVIEAKMRARRRRKCFPEETGWRETEHAGASVILLTNEKTVADKNESADEEKLLIESADRNKIC